MGVSVSEGSAYGGGMTDKKHQPASPPLPEHASGDPDATDRGEADGVPPPPPESVLSRKMFKSPKGNVYRITRTNQVDQDEPPARDLGEPS